MHTERGAIEGSDSLAPSVILTNREQHVSAVRLQLGRKVFCALADVEHGVFAVSSRRTTALVWRDLHHSSLPVAADRVWIARRLLHREGHEHHSYDFERPQKDDGGQLLFESFGGPSNLL